MAIRIDVWSDFVCPYCFAASVSLKLLKEAYPQVEIHWRSFELRPEGSPPIPPWYMQRIETARPQFARMMAETYGIQVESGPFGITSRKALIGAKYAESVMPDGGAAYHDTMLRAYWVEAQDISDVSVLSGIAASLGMDADAFAVALDDPALDQAVAADVHQAAVLGLSGVPALLFEEQFLLSGAQPVEVLRHVVERIEADGGVSLMRA